MPVHSDLIKPVYLAVTMAVSLYISAGCWCLLENLRAATDS